MGSTQVILGILEAAIKSSKRHKKAACLPYDPLIARDTSQMYLRDPVF